MNTWVNGRRTRAIDCRDRGLQYGDGLFETMRIEEGAVRLLDLHLARLYEGCRRLGFAAPAEPLLRGELRRAAARHEAGVLKLILTRGVGPRGYRPSGAQRCTRILALSPLPRRTSPGAPLILRLCRTRLGRNEALAGLKSLNRLECVMARREWTDPGIAEGLMQDGDGHLVCGTMSNLFLRRGRILATPLLDRCGVAGTMRRWVMGQSRALHLKLVERRIGWADLARAEEIFMTNAVAGVMSVAEVRHARERIRPPSQGAGEALRARLAAL